MDRSIPTDFCPFSLKLTVLYPNTLLKEICFMYTPRELQERAEADVILIERVKGEIKHSGERFGQCVWSFNL